MKTLDEWSIEMVDNLKEAINLMIMLDDDKNFNLSNKDKLKFMKLRKDFE